MHLALYCFATSQLTSALKLMYRARYLVLLVFGEDHPEMSQCDVSYHVIVLFHLKSKHPLEYLERIFPQGEYDFEIKFKG